MIAPKDFSLPGGELTPTMKLKRHTVMEMYEKKIQQVILKIDHLDRFYPNSISMYNEPIVPVQMYEHETQSSMW